MEHEDETMKTENVFGSKVLNFYYGTLYDFQKLRLAERNRVRAIILRVANERLGIPLKKATEGDDKYKELYTDEQVQDYYKDMMNKNMITAPEASEMSKIQYMCDQTNMLEKQFYNALDSFASDYQIYVSLREHKVKGLGPALISGLISIYGDSLKFATVSKMWAYTGLAPEQKREKGKQCKYNVKAKTLMWKISKQFLMNNNEYYRAIFDRVKDREFEKLKAVPENAEKKGLKGWAVNRANRYVQKRFLSDYWVFCRALLNKPELITKPYPVEHLGHVSIEYPDWVKDELTKEPKVL